MTSKRRNTILPEDLQGTFTKNIKPDAIEPMAREPLMHSEIEKKKMKKRKEEILWKKMETEKRMYNIARKFKKVKQNKKETSRKMNQMENNEFKVKKTQKNEAMEVISNKETFSGVGHDSAPSEKKNSPNMVTSKRRNTILPEDLQGMYTKNITRK